MMEYLEDHQIEDRLSKLAASTTLSDDEFKSQLEAIDRDFSSAMAAAQKQVSQRQGLPWSVELMEARKQAKYWHLWVKELRTGINYSRLRHQLRSQFVGPEPFEDKTSTQPSLNTTQKHRNTTRKAYRQIK